MPKVIECNEKEYEGKIPESIKGKRHLTPVEIDILRNNHNVSSDPEWRNVFVCEDPEDFDPALVESSEFHGLVVLGRLRRVCLKFHDLELKTGIYRSYLCDVVTGDDCVINHVNYLVNYHLGNRVMLFNIQEMSCTNHSKFGEGILKEGEPESNRIWIGVGNENDSRAVLPFTTMLPADAYLWSRFREDKALMRRFVELTEHDNDKKLNTFGIVDDDAVIKNCTLLKDARIGKCAYIKGAFKLKNITVLSSPEETSQIGEGVEMVNGIMGYGCHVFYQAVAVRFVLGRNCQLKYGARLLNSILGDNSTVSCCELLNNLIFPFHEQHHNSSFLIASTIMGQSNIASSATIGSNHNSRSPDGEMVAGRGFWPGLCSDFKYDSFFASFVLVSKGSYQNELNIKYPFSLVATCKEDNTVHVIPAYWFLYNMYAIVRNKYKFISRDKRVVKVQHIETDPLAPDTIQEVLRALDRLVELTARYLCLDDEECERMSEYIPSEEELDIFRKRARAAGDADELNAVARDFLHQCPSIKFKMSDERCQKRYGGIVFKIAQAYKEYRRIVKYFAVDTLIHWSVQNGIESISRDDLKQIASYPLYTEWMNVGGQIISCDAVAELMAEIKDHTIEDWKGVHLFYDSQEREYVNYKARYALYLLEYLYRRPMKEFTPPMFYDITQDVAYVSLNMLEASISSREKDYTDFFRSVTFRNKDEQEAVLGTLRDSTFLQQLKVSTEAFDARLAKIFSLLR